ncbi:hypothetical protein [Streptomonospora arabica]|uniref:Uncharacterized protein n=1 Tax=Streptomonospora arabica TaxID=412417 RepID=A0ABV9SSR2_9ACTN
MARVWSCGFELHSATSGMEWDGTAGSPTISTDVARSPGGASLRCNPAAGTAYIQHRLAAADTSPWWVRVYVYIAALPDADVSLVEAVDDANLVVASIRLTTTGTLQLHDDHETLVGASQVGSDSDALSNETWHRVELGIRPLGYGGEARLDGQAFASTPGTELVTGENLTRFRFGAITTSTVDLYLDDLAINGEGATPAVLRTNSMDGPDETAVTEANSGDHGDAFSSVAASGVTYDTPAGYYGSAGIRLDDASSSNGMQFDGGLGTGDFVVRFYAKRPAATTDGNLWWEDVLGAASMYTGGGLYWAGLDDAIDGALPDDTWTRVEVTREGDTGTLSVWYTDPESTGDADASITGTVDASTLTQWWLEHQASTGAILVDEWAIDDTATPIGPVTNPDYPGEGTIVHLRPNAGGNSADWDVRVGGGGGAAGNYTRVDDLTPDDASSYNAVGSAGALVDDLQVTNRVDAGIREDAVVTVLQAGARVGSDGATGDRDLALRLTSPEGVVTTGATIDAALDGWATNGTASPMLPTITAATNPDTGAAWTVDDLDTIQVGYTTVTSAVTQRRVSAVWVLVEFVQGQIPIGGPDLVGLPGVHSGVSNMPWLIVEAGFTATVTTGTTLHLDDPQRGILDTATLGGGEVWTDISEHVRSASTSRGSDRITTPVIAYDAGTGSVVLDNQNRLFDPTNLDGPFVASGLSQVSPMRRIRIRARWGSTTNYVVNPSFEDATTTGWTSNDQTDLSIVTAATSPFGGHALALTRTDSNLFEAHNAATAGAEGFSGGRIGEGVQITISAYVYIPPEVYDQVVDVAIVGGSGDISENAIDSAFVGKPSAAGAWERVSLTGTVNEGTVLYDVQWSIWTDGTIDPGTVVGYLDAAQCVLGDRPLPFTANEATYDLLRGYADQWDIAWTEPNDSTATATFTDAFKPFGNRELSPADGAPVGDGEDAGARVERLLDAITWPDQDRDIAVGDTTLQGTDLSGDVLSQLREIAETELGEIYIDGAGHVVFRNRKAMWEDDRSTRPQVIFGDAGDEHPYAELSIAYDDATLVNQAKITREGGTEQVSSDEQSRDEFLTYTYDASGLLLQTDGEAADYADLLVYMSSKPELRFESITIRPRRDRRLWPQVLGRELGDRIRIRRRPPGGGEVIERDCIIRGISHEIGPDDWVTTFGLQSASKAAFFVLDDPLLGRLGENALGF